MLNILEINEMTKKEKLDRVTKVWEPVHQLEQSRALPMNDTRFSAYFEGSINNFGKRMEDNIIPLRKKNESFDKKVSDKAASLLRRIAPCISSGPTLISRTFTILIY